MAADPGYVTVAQRSQLREGRALRITLDDEDIALWLVRGKLYAIDNVCCHQHLPVLFRGTVDDGVVTCPMHGWSYSLDTGRGVTGNGRIRTFRVKIDGENVMIERPAALW
jgi:nitrite reductase/ring-hydroxylating ferredoxin subunit